MIHQIGEREPGYVLLDSGLIVPEDVAAERARNRFTGVDLFAGAGGFSLGMIQAGGEVVAAVESDPMCVHTYMTNLCRWGRVQLHFLSDEDEAKLERELQRSFKEQEKKLKKNRKRVATTEYPRDKSDVLRFMTVAGSGWISGESDSVPGTANIIVGDVRKLTGQRLLEIIGMKKGELGCIFGGPPCQGFSVMGKRDRNDGRNPLVFEFARLVIETQPKTMVMENVEGIMTMKTPDGVPIVERFCAILRDGGFHGIEAFEEMLRRPGAAGAMRREKAAPKVEPTDQLDLFGGPS